MTGVWKPFKTLTHTRRNCTPPGPLRNVLTVCLPGWEVGIQTFIVGIRGSYDPDRWYANLIRFGLTAIQTDSLMRELVLQTLTELAELYNVRYAALQLIPLCSKCVT